MIQLVVMDLVDKNNGLRAEAEVVPELIVAEIGVLLVLADMVVEDLLTMFLLDILQVLKLLFRLGVVVPDLKVVMVLLE